MSDSKEKDNPEQNQDESYPTISSAPSMKKIDSHTEAFEEIGTQIGHYKLLSILGEGGFGIVYLAEQKEPIKRQVALKVIKPGMDSKQVIARFESERQALAILDHPNIAHVFDGGTTESGRLYFVMELVNGLPVTEYCDQQKLNIEERLKLFQQVCEAIQYAHQKGIIHRDIKPSNILVSVQSDRPIPMIIDFGVAKAVSQSLTERTLFTEQGQFIGTPVYMSPEQAGISIQNVDTRSDIYSLGVVLYELLTGSLPFTSEELKRAGFAEIQRIIRESDPPRPSVRLSSLGQEAIKIAEKRSTQIAVLRKRMEKELEWIPLKAMRKEPDRRYKTASELADDIRNYLNSDPLIAGPESKAYRFKKIVKRHRVIVTGVAAVLIVLSAGIVVSTIFAIGQARARTEANRLRMDDTRLRKIAEAERDKALEAERLAERAREKEALARTEAELAQKAEQEQRKVAEQALREKNEALGEAVQARDIAEAVKDFLTNDLLLGFIRVRAWEGNQDTTILRAALYAAKDRMDEGRFTDTPLIEAAIRTTLGNTFQAFGELLVAEQQLKRALYIYQQQLGEDNSTTLASMDDLASLYEEQGRYNEAEQIFVEVLEIKQRVSDKDQLGILEYMEKIASFYQIRKVQNRFDKLESLYAKMLDIRRRILGDEHPDTLESISNLGLVYLMQDRYDKAEPLLRGAVEASRRALGEQNISTIYLLNNSTMFIDKLSIRGIEEYRAGTYEQALATLKEADNLSQTILGECSPVDVAFISMALHQLNRDDEAKTTLNHLRSLMESPNFTTDQKAQNSLCEAEQLFAGENSRIYLAWEYIRDGKLQQASQLIEEIRSLQYQKDTDNVQRLQSAINGLAKAYYNHGKICECNNGQYKEAISNYEAAVRVDPNYALAFSDLAWLQATCPVVDFRDGAEAIRNATKACQLTGWKNCNQLSTLAAAYAEAGDFAAAIEWQRKTIDLLPERDHAVWQANYESRMELYKSHKPYYRVRIKTECLIGYWKFDGNAMDSSGNQCHGAEIRNVTYTAGISNRALALHGNGDHVIIPTVGPLLDGLDALTICLWIKSNITSTDRGFIIFEDPHGPDWRGIRYDWDGAYGGGTNVIKVAVTSTGGCQELESANKVQTLEWQHLAITWSSGNEVALFINGKPNPPSSNQPGRTGTLVGWTKMAVGKGSKDTPNRRSWRGLIDDVRIYNCVLNENEINGIYLGEFPGPLEN